MKKLYIFILMLLMIISISTAVFYFRQTDIHPIITPQQHTSKTILLIPLDSRPPCLDFVIELGKIANIKIIAPPKEILGDDRIAANPHQLRQWLSNNIDQADGAIISIDMLVHGGLIPSRHHYGTEQDVNDTLQLLEQIHTDRPALPLHVFNIIPRQTLADSAEYKKFQDELLEYSALTEKIYTFENPDDIARRQKLKKFIPASLLNQYQKLYDDNQLLNERLLDLADRKIIATFVLGQDDGEAFGIANMVKQNFIQQTHQHNADSQTVLLTRGADEIAQLLLYRFTKQSLIQSDQLKIYVRYNDDTAAKTLMPYMPDSVGTTVQDKIKLINGTITQNQDDADFILYVYIGTANNEDKRFAVNKEIQALLSTGKKTALVDLSENFTASQTIFPVLRDNNAPINQLIAYAGWNTTSNAIGTALTQAALFATQKAQYTGNDTELTMLYYNNLNFLAARYLEDWYYLKKTIDVVNDDLAGYHINPYRLDNNEALANALMQSSMQKNAWLLAKSSGWQQPLTIRPNIIIKPDKLGIDAVYPWHRTFEIDLKTTLYLKKL